MYVKLLQDKLWEQQEVYRRLKAGDAGTVCYQERQDAVYGTQDANYTNRMRLSYYLLYAHIDDEAAITYLFEEELKDRETNSFQGIGQTISILTSLLREYNRNHTYDHLFERAKTANFDCACGYDANVQISRNIRSNDLMDCIYLCQDMDYRDIMEPMVELWKESVSEWNDSSRRTLISFHSFLGREEENETLYKEQLQEARQTGTMQEIIAVYVKLIQHYLCLKQYGKARDILDEVLKTADWQKIRRIRLFGDLLEAAFEITENQPETAGEMWNWAKEQMQQQTNIYGNLYKKGIAAAKAVDDPYAAELEKEYQQWWEGVTLPS